MIINYSMNTLYPIFLKPEKLNILIIGGGNVGLEKLGFLLKSSPDANVEVISIDFLDEVLDLAFKHKVKLTQRAFRKSDLNNRSIVISATNIKKKNLEIHKMAKKKNLLINVADTPELCDFYLGGIVTKGNVKVAISTNGKSPTTAKRLRQFFEEVIPENVDDLVVNLNKYRNTIKGNFNSKVSKLNELTKSLIN